jgi:DNA helicase-2/ATP-dependent DNA helicase PcrA
MINELLSKLNNNQLEAVTAPLGPVVVVAGAGTGKTTVLTNRIIYIQEEYNIPSDKILAITFTNKAANEMKKRITKYGVSVPNFSTYHSFGVKFLKSEISFLNRNPNFTILDDDDQESLIRQIMKEAQISYKILSPTKAKNLISNIKSNEIELNVLDSISLMKKLGEYSFEIINPIKYIYKAYQQRLIDQNYVDFDDLLILTLKILDQAPDIADK